MCTIVGYKDHLFFNIYKNNKIPKNKGEISKEDISDAVINKEEVTTLSSPIIDFNKCTINEKGKQYLLEIIDKDEKMKSEILSFLDIFLAKDGREIISWFGGPMIGGHKKDLYLNNTINKSILQKKKTVSVTIPKEIIEFVKNNND